MTTCYLLEVSPAASPRSGSRAVGSDGGERPLSPGRRSGRVKLTAACSGDAGAGPGHISISSQRSCGRAGRPIHRSGISDDQGSATPDPPEPGQYLRILAESAPHHSRYSLSCTYQVPPKELGYEALIHSVHEAGCEGGRGCGPGWRARPLDSSTCVGAVHVPGPDELVRIVGSWVRYVLAVLARFDVR